MKLRAFHLYNQPSIAWAKQGLTLESFYGAVETCVQDVVARKEKSVLLYCDDTLHFAVGFFAALIARKNILLPPNARPGTLVELGGEGIGYLNDEYLQVYTQNLTSDLSHFNPEINIEEENIFLFTSGTTGAHKKICKTFGQFIREIDSLEEIFGARLKNATCLSTVSHQHLYGLLFRFLWPLRFGRQILSSTLHFPEELLQAAELAASVYVVSSPAQLKRMPHLIDIAQLQTCAIFSSGGALDQQTAQQFAQKCERPPIEVYGCSEAGGIAWRMQTPLISSHPWNLFPNVRVESKGLEKALVVTSPWTFQGQAVACGDSGEVNSDGYLELFGRLDRVVKVEEKRLSLDEMERRLGEHPYIKEAVVLWSEPCCLEPGEISVRGFLASAIILSVEGQKCLAEHENRWDFLQELKSYLGKFFEPVTIPRRWRMVTEFPKNQLGKIARTEIMRLFSNEPEEMSKSQFPVDPIVREAKIDQATASISLKVPEDLSYFAGHFPEQPVVPGFVQIDWVIKLAVQYLRLTSTIEKMEMVKFRDVLLPAALCTLELKWIADKNCLKFELLQDKKAYSSGKIFFSPVKSH